MANKSLQEKSRGVPGPPSPFAPATTNFTMSIRITNICEVDLTFARLTYLRLFGYLVTQFPPPPPLPPHSHPPPHPHPRPRSTPTLPSSTHPLSPPHLHQPPPPPTHLYNHPNNSYSFTNHHRF
ncbi:hypothetical protein M0802_005688 [Mischocyttarus mexicanus]|nr:hypothetical protein M0802_005688 [Mischocyttarus mexicanus]